MPEYRGAGVGTPLIQELMTEAAATGKTVTIYIEYFGSARRLFERLGFTPVEGDGYHALMEWRPSA
jgi:predicted GNAT family acetyltransferase